MKFVTFMNGPKWCLSVHTCVMPDIVRWGMEWMKFVTFMNDQK